MHDADQLQKVLKNEIDVNAPLVSISTVMILSRVYAYLCMYFKVLLHVHILILLNIRSLAYVVEFGEFTYFAKLFSFKTLTFADILNKFTKLYAAKL